MPEIKTRHGLRFLASTSIIALGLTAAPLAMDFELDKPVLKMAQAKDGGDSGGSGGGGGDSSGSGDGGNSGPGGGGGYDGSGGYDGYDGYDKPDKAGSDDEDGAESDSSGRSSLGFGDLEQVGRDLSPGQEADAISNGWQ